MSPTTRTWTYVAGGIVATAAVIGGIAFAAGVLPGTDQADSSPSPGRPSASHSPTATPSSPAPSSTSASAPSSASASSSPAAGSSTYAVYYVGTDPRGRPVLFREFHRGPALPAYDPGGNGDDVLSEAVRDALADTALDPDYASPWAGRATLDHASYTTTGAGKTLRVALGHGAPTARPAGMSPAEATAAVQQLVYTAQAAVGKRVPVTFTVGDQPPSTLLGVDISQPVPAGRVLDTLSLVSISDPNQGQVVSGPLKVSGANNGFEGTVVVYLERNGKHYLTQPTIGGMGGNRLYPWTVTLDTSKVRPGTYTLVAQNDDPSGRGHPAVDTRVIEVK